MFELMVIGLIGEQGFTDVLVGLPDEFFGLHKPSQEALWGAVLDKINEGTTDIKELIIYSRLWLESYKSILFNHT